MESTEQLQKKLATHIEQLLQNEAHRLLSLKEQSKYRLPPISFTLPLVATVLLFAFLGPVVLAVGLLLLYFNRKEIQRLLNTQRKKDAFKHILLSGIAEFFGTVSYYPPNYITPSKQRRKGKRQIPTRKHDLLSTQKTTVISDFLHVLLKQDHVYIDEHLEITHTDASWSIWDIAMPIKKMVNSEELLHGIYLFQPCSPSHKETIIFRQDGSNIFQHLHAYKQLFRSSKKALSTVHLEDPDFEKRFEVQSTNQVSARELFTPSFMEEMKQREEDILFALEPNGLHIFVVSSEDSFEFPNTSPTEKEIHDYCISVANKLLHLYYIRTYFSDSCI